MIDEKHEVIFVVVTVAVVVVETHARMDGENGDIGDFAEMGDVIPHSQERESE